MVNARVVFGFKSGYSSQSQKVCGFLFPFEKSDLHALWVKFVNRTNGTPTKNSIICAKHFKYGKKFKVETLTRACHS